MAANPIQAPAVDVPRHVWDAVNNAIHTSKIDGNLQPISLCYVAVRAALSAYATPPAQVDSVDPIDVPCPQCHVESGNRCCDWIIGVYEYTFHNARIDAAKRAVSA